MKVMARQSGSAPHQKPISRAALFLLFVLLSCFGHVVEAGEPLFHVIGENDLTRVRQTNRFPFSAVVRLRNFYDHKTNSCSGTMVASNLVLTAAHCLYDKGEGAFANSILVYPGKNGGHNVYGSHPAHHYLVSPGYILADWWEAHAYDWALVVLEDHIGDQTGWFEVDVLDPEEVKDEVAYMIGYPNGHCEGCPFTGKNLHLGMGPFSFVAEGFFLHGIDTMPGSSGSGVFLRRQGRPVVVGVHSTSGDEQSILNIAARLTLAVVEVLATEGGRFGARFRCEGYTGTNPCCRPGDPCRLAVNGKCECQGECGWDEVDCGQEEESPRCQPCIEDDECEPPFYCGHYSSYPEVSFCVNKCADLDCPEQFYCSGKDTCWVTGRDVCHYGHVWREDICGNRYKLVEVCHSDELCVAGSCLSLPPICLLDGGEPDDQGTTAPESGTGSWIRSLCPGTDEDHWKISQVPDELIDLETWGAWGDTHLTITDSGGEILATDDSSGLGDFSRTSVVVPADGNLLVAVTLGGGTPIVPRYVLQASTAKCVPDCEDAACGSDGCNGVCGACPDSQTCVWGQCVCAAECDVTECGFNDCGGDCGECTGDLAVCAGGVCFCTSDCADRVCGSDGCGGSCGECDDDLACIDGECGCAPQCGESLCGDDGCGGNCGACGNQELCINGQCACLPACEERNCGLDGCGGVCGVCNAPQFDCLGGHCTCQPDCGSRECGLDGCGGDCGQCLDGLLCNLGSCEVPATGCEAICGSRECGVSDGCYCGTCASGTFCNGGKCGPAPLPDEVPDVASVGDDGEAGCTAGGSDAGRLAWLLLILVMLLVSRYRVSFE